MLVLQRKKNESIIIAKDIKITVVEIRGDKVRLAIQADRSIPIHRKEIWERIQVELHSADKPSQEPKKRGAA